MNGYELEPELEYLDVVALVEQLPDETLKFLAPGPVFEDGCHLCDALDPLITFDPITDPPKEGEEGYAAFMLKCWHDHLEVPPDLLAVLQRWVVREEEFDRARAAIRGRGSMLGAIAHARCMSVYGIAGMVLARRALELAVVAIDEAAAAKR